MYLRIDFLAALLATTRLAASIPAGPPEGNIVFVTDVETETKIVVAPTGAAPHHVHHAWQGMNHPRLHHHAMPQPQHTEESTPESSPTSTPDSDGSYGSRSSTHGKNLNYQATVLHHHNVHRANHSAHPVVWSDSLAATAAKIASSCVYAHNTQMDGGGYGQNIAAGPPPDYISKVISNMFYNNEEPWFRGQYGKASPSMENFEHWGHFSQIVWKGTYSVGCHTQDCSNHPGKLRGVGSEVHPYFTVCNYHSRGNMGGQYGKNIGHPLGHPTVYGV